MTPAAIQTAYDRASEAYARKFLDELDHKPLDREWLGEFASRIGPGGPVLDLGCGPGHTTAYLTALGLSAAGIDLSPRMVEQAAERFPQARFEVGDFLALRHEPRSVAGILALYCIVHLKPDQLRPAFAEMFRVLGGSGVLLLSFHVGSGVVRSENFLDSGAALDFTLFDPAEVTAALKAAGFDPIDVRLREPYPTEYASTRCYIFAPKPAR
jgi:SAM-dependent methyltransferase